MKRVILFVLLLHSFLFICSCKQRKPKQQSKPAAAEIAKSKAVEAEAYYATHHPSHFQAFLENQIDVKSLQPESAWKIPPDDTERWIIPMDYNDPPDTCFAFPFDDIKMTYCIVDFGIENDPYKSCSNGSQFTINNVALPLDKDCQRCDPLITANTIRRYRYRNLQFILMWGRLKDFNGYGDRIQFNYFFDITQKPYAQDIYTNDDVYVYHPILYGNLNDDALLDRIVYDGIEYPYCDDTCLITIEAQTYKHNKWKALKDVHGKPYYIKVYTDGYMNNFRVMSSNWMRPLSPVAN